MKLITFVLKNLVYWALAALLMFAVIGTVDLCFGAALLSTAAVVGCWLAVLVLVVSLRYLS
jgi:hypothetical protein